ncbi:MAG: hypothetical protein PHP23_07215 [Desulfobacterales bacterium]|nr:hypothetical protein [Desulfobacterales bacterium]MDD4072683.1 hypothetical protein [Desulfobacterales bacterium]MDD4391876.1 hypothetical protein [Desulfobacterales bacterium]
MIPKNDDSRIRREICIIVQVTSVNKGSRNANADGKKRLPECGRDGPRDIVAAVMIKPARV